MGQGAEAILSNSEASDLLFEVLEPYFAVGRYDEGVLNLYSALFDRVCRYYGLDLRLSGSIAVRSMMPSAGVSMICSNTIPS